MSVATSPSAEATFLKPALAEIHSTAEEVNVPDVPTELAVAPVRIVQPVGRPELSALKSC